MNNILAGAQQKNSRRRFISLLLSATLLGLGVGVPAQIINSAPASAVGAATKIVLTTPAGGGATGIAFTTQPQLTLQDALGNTVFGSSPTITLSVSTSGDQGEKYFVGTSTATVDPITGTATFIDLGLNAKVPLQNYTISYLSTGLTSATQVVTRAAVSLPDWPTSISGSQSGDIMTMTITAPKDRGSPILNYQYSFDEITWVDYSPALGAGSSVVLIINLSNEVRRTSWSFYFKTVTGFGVSRSSNDSRNDLKKVVTIGAAGGLGPPYAQSTGRPRVSSGSLTSGVTLQNYVTFGGSPTLAYAYKWQSCTSNTDLTTCADISGAIASTYVVTVNEVGKYIRDVVTATNDLGTLSSNSSVTSTSVSGPDLTPPSAPTALALSASSDSGSSNSDLITNATTLVFTGTAEANSTVQLYVDGVATGNTCTATGGSFSCTTGVLSPGSKAITALATDAAFNTSTASTAVNVTIDTTAPTVTLAASAANSASGTITFTLTGSEAIACSTLSTVNGTDFDFTNISSITGIVQTSPTVCTITATSTATEGGGAVTSSLATAGAGSFSVSDTAGNAQTTLTGSPASTVVTITDATAPTLSLTSASSIATSTATLNFTSNEAGTYYYLIYADVAGAPDAATIAAQGTAVTKATAAAGASANTANATGLVAGTAYKAYVIVKDSSGNASAVSTISLTTTIPTPATPDLQSASDSGISSTDDNTSDNTPTITVSGTLAGTGVITASKAGSLDVTCTLSAGSCTLGLLADGNWSITVTDTGPAGGTSISSALTITVDTAAPTQTVSGIDISADTGSSSSDFTTATASQTITATLSVALGAGESLWGSLDAGSSYMDISSSVSTTAVSWASATLNGSSSIKLQVRDAAGNVGSIATQAYVLDASSPTQTVTGIHISADTAGSSTTDFITKTASQTITATLSAVLVSGESLWASLDAGSSYTDISLSVSSTSVSWASATLSGTSSIKLQVRDAAGNVGSIATQTYVLDTVAPTITAISSSSSDATYKLGSTITITATASETVLSGATFVVTLETGTTDRTVTLTASADGTTLTGTYTVQSGDVSADLTANAISAGTISDVAGNVMTSTTPPSGGNNIAGTKAIVVDGVVPTVTATTADVVFGGNAVVQSTETGIVYLVNTSVSVEDLASITGAAGALWNSVSIASAATNTDLAVTGLNAGTYKAYAVDAAGNLSAVSTGTVTVLPEAPGIPVAPTAVAGDTRVTVTVVAPSGGTPSSYLITASPQVGGVTKTCTVSGASGSCVVNGLVNGEAYTFTATATNTGGTSSASAASNSATPNDSPVAPLVASTPAPTGTVTNGSTLTSAVTFTGTPTPDLTYTWQRCTSSTDFATCTTISGATASTYVLTDTDAAKYIRSVVTATNTTAPAAVGTSAVTAVIAPVAPAAPTSLVATAGDGSAVISFTQGSNGGSAITNYKYSLDGTNFTLLSPADATSPITITGLTNGTAYTIYLEAVNIAGISIPSDPVSVTPADVTPPTLVSSVLAADGLTLTLTYNETLSATTASTSEYTITVNGASVTISTAVVSGLTVVLTLASAVDQGKTVLAAYTDPTTSNDANAIQDAAGNDAATFTAQSVTNNSSHVSTPGTPPAPTAVAGDAQVTVTVTASNSGGTPASYVVTASPGGATCSVTGAAGSCVVSGLTNGTPYTFTSTATNTSGSSSPSPDSASATPVAVVVPPTPTPTPTPVVPTPVVPTPVVPTIVVPTPVTPTLPAPEVIAAAKVVVEKVVVDTVVAVAAAKVAVEKAVEAVAVKVTAEKIVAAVEAQVAVAAIAQKTAITIAAQAVVELKSSTNAAVTKASTSPTTQKAVVSVATTVKTAVAAATKTATALAIAANSNKPLDITVGALASKTASAETIAAANVIAAAAKAAADRVAKVATDKATSAKNAAIVATKEATVAAALIVTEQKQASDAAIFAKEAADTMLKATLEKSTTTAEAQIATDAVVQALNEKAQLADDAVKATDETVRLEIAKKIDQATLKIADLQKVADAAVQKADTANKTQAVAKAASDAAVKEASVQAAQAVAAKTESAAKSAVAVQAAVAATVAAKVATAAKAEAAKVPATAAVVPKASTTTKNSAQATVTGLKPGQKVKVTVNIKVK